jgi:hypothetical protein
MAISHGEIVDLLDLLWAKGVLEYDEQAVEEKLRAAGVRRRLEGGRIPFNPDARAYVIMIRLAEYRRAPEAELVENSEKLVSWQDEYRSASWSGVEEIKGLTDCIETLRAFWTHEELEYLEEADEGE